MYKTLSSWRGLLVVVIVLYHTPILELCEAAHMGVSLCFVMSGALLAMRHPRAECSWWQWMWPRARRIYLTHWLVLALLLIMQWPMGDCVTDWTLPANALLVQAWVPVRDFCLSCNKPSWFLCALLACYACYPLLSRLMSCLSLKCKWMIAVSLLVAHCVVMGVVSVEMRDWFFFLPVIRLGEFVWGMVVGASLPSLDKRLGDWLRARAHAVEAAVVAFVLAVIIAVGRMPWLDCCEDIAVWWLPVSCIVAMSVLLNGSEGLVGRLMLTWPMRWLGSINLEVYLLALPVTYFYSHYLAAVAGHFGHPEFYGISWPITLPLILITASIFHCLTKKIQKR